MDDTAPTSLACAQSPLAPADEASDDALLALFRRRPQVAWEQFLERYAGRIVAQLRGLGLESDDAMDCFVFVCERLARDRWRRLRDVQRTGARGELVPWLRQVVRHAAIDWGWSRHGRRRLLRSVAALGPLEQRVFQLHYWHGQTPTAMLESLRAEGRREIDLEQVFDALEHVLHHLDAGQRWRLLSQLGRRRPVRPIAAAEPDAAGWEPPSPAPSPEGRLLAAERARVVENALAELPARDRLIFKLRFEDGLTLPEMATVLSLGLTTLKTSLRRSRERLRAACREVTP